jgi:ribosomal protein L30/L7E
MEKTITIKWKRSAIGRPRYQEETIKGLGFKRLNQLSRYRIAPKFEG